MDRYKIQIVLFTILLLFTSCKKEDKKITNDDIDKSNIKMMVILSNDYNFFNKTYFRFYDKDNNIIKEKTLNVAGYYTNKIINNEMFLLGSNLLYKVNLNDFSIKKLNIPNKNNDIIFDLFHIENDNTIYKKNTFYDNKANSLVYEFCLYKLTEKNDTCKNFIGIIKNLYIKNSIIYVLVESDEYSEVFLLDLDLNIISKNKYDEINTSEIFEIKDKIYIKFSEKIYDLENNIIYEENKNINYVLMPIIKYRNDLHVLYMGNPSNICNINNECYSYDAMLNDEGISFNNGIVFSGEGKLINKTILEDIILFEDNNFKKIHKIEYPLGLNIVGIYYK